MQLGMLLCTLDVTSLYTNIPHNEGIQSIKEMLAIHKPPNSLPQSSYIIELLEVMLTNNHFEFNGKHYHQVSETAMGTKLAPSYANLVLPKFEKNMYIHILYNQTMEEVHRGHFSHIASWIGFTFGIHRTLNTVHPTIKFTSDISHTEISFSGLNNIH